MTESSPAATTSFICRFCGGIAFEPGSTCPHCGREVMALCPNCKRYVDNQLEQCDHCGTPLAAVSHIGRILSAPAAERARTPAPDTSLPDPPRTLSEAQWQQVGLVPALVAGVTLVTFLVIEVTLLGPAALADTSGLFTTMALAALLYPGLAIFGAYQLARFRYRLLRDGVAVRGQIERVEGRTAQHRLSQLVRFGFVDLRGEPRSGATSPLGSLAEIRPGDPVTVLYLPDEPAQCTVYPFLF